jgi:hypothetical protein
MRSVLLRGWGIEHEAVWAAFLVVLGWIVLWLGLAAMRIKAVD